MSLYRISVDCQIHIYRHHRGTASGRLVGLFLAFLIVAGLLLPLVAVATGDYR